MLVYSHELMHAGAQPQADKEALMLLEGKVAIVTGGAQGIGRSYCLRFAQEGASVAVLDLRAEQANTVAEEITKAGGAAIPIVADVTSEDAMARAVDTVTARFGRVDILVNNAALYYDMDLMDQSISYLKKILEINVLGVIISARAVFPQMQRQRSGSIINIASIGAYPLGMGNRSGPDLTTIPISGYGLSKSGVIFVTKNMAESLGRYNIRVNAIAPGVTMTEATKRVTGGRAGGPDDTLVKLSALGKTLEPEDLTGAATFLASDDSAFMTGQTLVVDGGRIMVG